MSAIDNLAAAFNDVRATVVAAVERIQYLTHDLAYARVEAADAAAVEQIAAELHATADQLRGALAASDPTQPQA
ncbi:hypothetical protein [Methylocystis sp. S23]|jgi:hypothetical protein